MKKQDIYFLTRKIIKKSFPVLNEIDIKIVEKKRGEYSAHVQKSWNKYKLFINKEYFKIYNKKEIIGVLAHELSHIEGWVTKGVWFYITNTLKCSFSERCKAIYEKETDKTAICKGYRKELKAQRIKRETKKDRKYYRNKKFYLTPDEIGKIKC